MAVPKRRTSRSNTRHRRSQWKAAAPDLVPVTVAGERFRVPRRLVAAVRAGLVDPATGRPTGGRSR
ncbi:50S ribosomal protein L32 [Nocardioides humi]|uniref:Large ribosomal subunit protein bL32 n=1 Tax=Nocardioides humi TaxID=449461 RepID=A0ABN2A569_9ACTN|nr:50S ribosomal protein L32 [Nocardioides humi]